MRRRAARPDQPSAKPIYTVTLIIESDDEDEVERISQQVAACACPAVIDGYTEPHTCKVPYMVMTTRLNEKSAKSWRSSLNR